MILSANPKPFQPQCTSCTPALPASKQEVEAPEPSADFVELNHWMAGEYNNFEQAAQDPNFAEINMGLRPIWPEHSSSQTSFFYIEAAQKDRYPYRQAINKVTDVGNNTFVSQPYAVPDPKAFFFADGNSEVFKQYQPQDLQEKSGCAVYLHREEDGLFRGKTEIGTCRTDFNGANYITSQSEIGPNNLKSWDRGHLDGSGEVMWGPETAYLFEKVNP